MAAFVARFFPRASEKSSSVAGTFITVAIFSGVGLLLSLTVLVLDKYVPGDWF